MAPKPQPKVRIAAQISNDAASVKSQTSISQLSGVSQTSSLLVGSVSSAASRVPLKESKAAIRERKIIFWTPVMIWPTGFSKEHKKETVEYMSSDCLHNGKYPFIPQKIKGGVIVDLQVTDVADQVSKLLEIGELVEDEQLCVYLKAQISSIKDEQRVSPAAPQPGFNLLESDMFKQLPTQQKFAIESSLQYQAGLGSEPLRLLMRQRKREAKACQKDRDIHGILQAKRLHEGLTHLKPKQISRLLKVDVLKVYRAQQKLRLQIRQPRVVRAHLRHQEHQELVSHTHEAIQRIGLPYLSVAKVHAYLKANTSLTHCPGMSSIREILLRDFQLRFKASNAANIKYNDTDFDEKRLWVSRLLAQFMMADVLIVSIDESSFKQEGLPKRYWQASSKTIKQVFKSAEVPRRNGDEQLDTADQQAQVQLQQTKTGEQKTPTKGRSIGLTPLNERLAALRLSSGIRRSPRLSKVSSLAKDAVRKDLMGQLNSSDIVDEEQKQPSLLRSDAQVEGPQDQTGQAINLPRQMALQQRKKGGEKHTGYSLSMIAAITQDCVISAQVTEGGTDAVVFDNFLHRTLHKLRSDKDSKSKHIVILMDNATIHKHPIIYQTARQFKANILLNAQYSPWLNPIEQLFNYIKR